MRSAALFDRAIEHIQSPLAAQHIAELVVETLAKIEGFSALPDPLRQAIERRVSEIYGVGFVQGARWREG